MALSNERKSAIISDYQREGTDTGSPEVQVALLSAQIESLAEHFKIHAHDNHSRQGLLKMVNSRRKMLSYLKNKDISRYSELISRLGLRK
jgi:small subunit ribosomal protein S15